MSTRRDYVAIAALAAAAIALVFGVVSLGRSPAITVTEPQPDRTIRVQGIANLDVRPDTAAITLGVRVQRGSAADAQAAGAAALNKIIPVLTGLGVPESGIKSSRISLNPVYSYATTPRITGYESESLLTITTQDLDQVGRIVDEAVRAGANDVRSVSFSLKDTAEAVRRALDAAIDDARKKADQVAARTNREIVGVQAISVDEQSGGRPVVYRSAMKAMESADESLVPMLPGTVQFSVVVTASYLIK